MNNYCLITGASEGLGKALAIECASRKMNLILVALPEPHLYNFAEWIKENYSIEVVAIGKDLSREENCMLLFDEVCRMNLNVNMLINNVGIGSTHLFAEGSIDFYQRQLNLNIMTVTVLTRLFLGMLKKNNPSYILNVGSLCSFFFLARKQVYGATKSFVYFFSKSLKRELYQDNVHVSVLCPGAMNTNPIVTAVIKSSSPLVRAAVVCPEEVARVAIKGLLKKKEVIIPGNLNKIFLFMNTVVPSSLKKMITNRHMKSLNSAGRESSTVVTIPVSFSRS